MQLSNEEIDQEEQNLVNAMEADLDVDVLGPPLPSQRIDLIKFLATVNVYKGSAVAATRTFFADGMWHRQIQERYVQDHIDQPTFLEPRCYVCDQDFLDGESFGLHKRSGCVGAAALIEPTAAGVQALRVRPTTSGANPTVLCWYSASEYEPCRLQFKTYHLMYVHTVLHHNP